MNIRFPLILDGAMGTQLYKAGLPSGACPEQWILENPEAAKKIQSAYVEAGSQIIYAPTFGANSVCLEAHGLFNKVEEYNLRLVALAKETAAGKALVAGDISSTGKMLYPMGDMNFEDYYEVYREQAAALEKAGVDLFVIETIMNLAEARAALLAVKSVSSKPVFVSFSCSENGRTMMGTDVCAALLVMQGMGADAFGLNCSTGPEQIVPQIERISRYASVPVIVKPNAGLPETIDGKSVYNVGAEEFASFIPQLAQAGARIFGGCCGTDEKFIAGIRRALASVQLAEKEPEGQELLPCATEKDAFLLDPDTVCSTVLECDEELEDNIYELEDGVLFGIEIASPEDVAAFTDLQYAIRNPLCLLCEDAQLLEKALRAYQGRALYEGSLSDAELLPLVEKYGLII